MLVGDIYNLIVLYHSLARCLSEAETEKDFLRLKKKAGGYEKVLKKLCRSLGLPEEMCIRDRGNTEWVLLMRKRRRKTLVVCPECLTS